MVLSVILNHVQIASNKIKDIVRFFKNELIELYSGDEIDVFIAYCFEKFLNIKRADIRLKQDATISESELLKFNFAVKDLKRHKPIQYILEEADFYGLKFYVNGYVLIPRPETEELVHLIINDIKDHFAAGCSVLDIGTGSGCIPVTLKKQLSQISVTALDVSEQALLVAQKNAIVLATDVLFLRENILQPSEKLLNSRFDIVVSNPPYIAFSEKDSMHKNVLDFEPHLALFVQDNDPLLFYRSIAEHALKMLNTGGKLYFEINERYGLQVKELMEGKGYKNVEVLKDLSNKNRILRGTI